MSIKYDSNVLEKTETTSVPKHPEMYDVIIYNDDITPMDAVIIILMEAFGKDIASAIQLMMQVHTSDKGLVGTYSMEEAYKRLDVADDLKAEMNVPLIITVEEH